MQEKTYTQAEMDAAISAEREACVQVAMDHECGGEDDILCQGQNCGLLIASAIKARSNALAHRGAEGASGAAGS